MDTSYLSLTVYFEDPFWVGVAERRQNGRLCAAKVTFGAEPRDQEVWQWVLTRWQTLRFSPAVEAGPAPRQPASPKRAQRQAARALEQRGVGTKAQQALSALREQGKQARQTQRKEQRQALAEQKFLLRRQKRLDKHKGR